MSYCQNCGTEINGNFCPNCGTKSDSFTPENSHAPAAFQPVIHDNITIKPRYGAFSLFLGGVFGFPCCTAVILIPIISLFMLFNGICGFGEFLLSILLALFYLAFGLFFYLPGILTITKRSPKGTVKKTFLNFFIKSALFTIYWCIAGLLCFTLIGIVLKAWRIGLRVSRPNDNEYTAFVDGQKISVTRYPDDFSYGGTRSTYIYQDGNGEFYRPRVGYFN